MRGSPNQALEQTRDSVLRYGESVGCELLNLIVRFLKLMARFPQTSSARGSQHWLQKLVSDRDCRLNESVCSAIGHNSDSLEWLSPLQSDDFAEYRDGDFVSRLGLDPRTPIEDFWPRNGPQWDGLAKTQSSFVLVEAKSHLLELASPRCGAGQRSFTRISRSILETQLFMNASPKIEWTGTGYQYANRIAHLYFLRKLNDIDAHMVFLCFANDPTIDRPVSVDQWKGALQFLDVLLGIRNNRLSRFIHHVIIDVTKPETNNAMHPSRGSGVS
jgi:hypothetical protein